MCFKITAVLTNCFKIKNNFNNICLHNSQDGTGLLTYVMAHPNMNSYKPNLTWNDHIDHIDIIYYRHTLHIFHLNFLYIL